jgi:hypothetical protein
MAAFVLLGNDVVVGVVVVVLVESATTVDGKIVRMFFTGAAISV